MTDGDRAAFAGILAGLAEVFGEAVSDLRAEGYFQALRGYDMGEIEAMAASAISHCRFFPRPADLIEQLEGSEADRAEAAWRIVDMAFRDIGQYQSVRFADAAIAEALLQVWGGWIEANEDYHELEEPAWIAKRKEFLSAYRAADRHRNALSPRALPGLHEQRNAAKGFQEIADHQRKTAALVGITPRRALSS
ncbi:MAG: hypothetical protein HY323_09335 [Betaproteobacteria bacterium]|nr:hypothetical protein [Betaproteobacteria bacterium]